MDQIARLSFRDEKGCAAIVVADILVTFDAAELSDDGLRQAVTISEKHVAGHITYFRTEAMTRARPVKESATSILDEWLSDPPAKRGSMSVEFFSGTSDSSVGPYAFRLSVPANNPEYEAGYIQLSLPGSVAYSEPDLLRQITSDVSLLFRTTWGRAGFAVEYDMLSSNSARDQEIVKWCTRFEGIDLRHLILLAEKALTCVPSVGWLNIIPIETMKELRSGGLDSHLQEVPLGTDLVGITVDERPVLGDRNRNEDVSGYRAAYSMLRERLCDSPPVRRVMKREQILNWSRRFEEGR
jgi:hypothetical protein